MVCLGFEPGAAGWQGQTKPWSYDGHHQFKDPLSRCLATDYSTNVDQTTLVSQFTDPISG